MRYLHLSPSAPITLLCLVVMACVDRTTPPATTAPSAASFAAAPVATGYIETPAGYFHVSCVHEVPSGTHVDLAGVATYPDSSRHQLPHCAYPSYRAGSRPPWSTNGTNPTTNGWVEDANTYATSGFAFEGLVSGWRVPPNPASPYSTPGLVYYAFPGISPASGANIYQPVIQYGNNHSFGGAYWTMADWTCGNTSYGCAHSGPVSISAGDSIYAYIYADGAACSFDCNIFHLYMRDVNTGQATVATFSDTQDYTWAFGGVVESYGLTTCSQFPATGPKFGSSFYQYPDTGGQYYNGGAFALSTTYWNHVVNPVSPSCGYGVTTTTGTLSFITLSHY